MSAAACGRLGFDAIDGDADDVLPSPQRTLVTGWQHACLLEPTGDLVCWGVNDFAQLGVGIGPSSSTPIAATAGHTWTAVAAGHLHTCALDEEGAAWCWGGNDNSELGLAPPLCGNGTLDPGEGCDDSNTANGDSCTSMCQPGAAPPVVTTPQLVPTPVRFRSIAALRSSTCAIALDDTLWCWGLNTRSQLGLGSNENRGTPTQVSIVAPQLGVDTMWAEAAVGDDHTCARQHDGSVWCWGDAGNGQLGQGATPFDRTRPSVVAAGSMWLTIDAGADVTCAIAADAGLWCWGLNNVSQLGLGDTMPRDVPTSVAPIGWARLAVGRVHACALKQDGTIWCWGENVHGQIGNATLGGAQSTPAPITGTWLDLDAGSDFTCALDIDEAVWCWGTGDDGRLGTGTTTDTPVPTRVVAPL